MSTVVNALSTARLPRVQPGTARRLLARLWPLVAFNLIVWPVAFCRAIADNIGFGLHAQFSLAERIVFFTRPTQLLQSFLLFRPLEVAAAVIYLSWLVLPLTAGLPLMIANDSRRYCRLVIVMGMTYAVAIPMYMLYPLQPPWAHDPSIQDVVRHAFPQIATKDPNPYATMPSMHIAMPAAAALWYGWRKPWGRVLWGYTALLAVTVVYTGDHYVADVAGGLMLAGAVCFVMSRIPAWSPQGEAPPAIVRPAVAGAACLSGPRRAPWGRVADSHAVRAATPLLSSEAGGGLIKLGRKPADNSHGP